MSSPRYFDHNATTPLHPGVRAAMLPWLGERWGNPSSAHSFGRPARVAVEAARQQVASLLGARPEEVVFTASGTEANNAVLFDCAHRAGMRGHLVLSTFEHASVAAAATRLEGLGMRVTRVPPGPDGVVPAAAMLAALEADTRLLCLMLANNELGTLQPVAEVAAECRRRGVPVLCDAVQAVGKVPVDVTTLGADYLVLGAHKFYGPLGAAAVWRREGRELIPFLLGAGQEGGQRASTENVAAIVGLGQAAALAEEELPERGRHLAALRDAFEAGLPELAPAVVHGAGAPRLPNTSNVAFPGATGFDVMQRLDQAGFAVSTGAACHSGVPQPSATVLALGVPREQALGALRISFGRTNTAAEVNALLRQLAVLLPELRRSGGAG